MCPHVWECPCSAAVQHIMVVLRQTREAKARRRTGTNSHSCTLNESESAMANWIYHAMPSLLLPGKPGAPSQSSYFVILLRGREKEAEAWGGGNKVGTRGAERRCSKASCPLYVSLTSFTDIGLWVLSHLSWTKELLLRPPEMTLHFCPFPSH